MQIEEVGEANSVRHAADRCDASTSISIRSADTFASLSVYRNISRATVLIVHYQIHNTYHHCVIGKLLGSWHVVLTTLFLYIIKRQNTANVNNPRTVNSWLSARTPLVCRLTSKARYNSYIRQFKDVYCKTLIFQCILISRFWSVENLRHFNFAFLLLTAFCLSIFPDIRCCFHCV